MLSLLRPSPTDFDGCARIVHSNSPRFVRRSTMSNRFSHPSRGLQPVTPWRTINGCTMRSVVPSRWSWHRPPRPAASCWTACARHDLASQPHLRCSPLSALLSETQELVDEGRPPLLNAETLDAALLARLTAPPDALASPLQYLLGCDVGAAAPQRLALSDSLPLSPLSCYRRCGEEMRRITPRDGALGARIQAALQAGKELVRPCISLHLSPSPDAPPAGCLLLDHALQPGPLAHVPAARGGRQARPSRPGAPAHPPRPAASHSRRSWTRWTSPAPTRSPAAPRWRAARQATCTTCPPACSRRPRAPTARPPAACPRWCSSSAQSSPRCAFAPAP